MGHTGKMLFAGIGFGIAVKLTECVNNKENYLFSFPRSELVTNA